MTKYTAVIQTLSNSEKAHRNESNKVLQGTINSRPTKKAHLKNLRATNARHVPYTAAKDHLGSFNVERHVLT